MLTQGTDPLRKPMKIAAQPSTKDPAGVIATRPVIRLWIAPITDGFLKNMMSRRISGDTRGSGGNVGVQNSNTGGGSCCVGVATVESKVEARLGGGVNRIQRS